MIDIKLLRENFKSVKNRLESRGKDFSYLDDVLLWDEERREIIKLVESIKKERNEISKEIGEIKRKKEDATSLMEKASSMLDVINENDYKLKELDNKIENALLQTPNLLHESVPFGKDEADNVELKKHLDIPKFSFTPRTHYELGEELDILDFNRASKITGSRFVIYKGMGARLERALISFMMDLHSNEFGYVEIIPPYIVNKDSMLATGQLPKFEEDSFKVNVNDWFLNPTAEVPVINMYRNEVIDNSKLPIYHCGYTMAFRSEAGSAGRDTRGLIRTHQFNKVELIKITRPEDSYQELEKMLLNSEEVLKRLKLPYRVISLCTGDMGFAMAKTYDIEVWLPSQNTYREIGSISNAEDYQARRGNIKFKRDKDSKLEFIHTLNGSGLAVGRTLTAILENYQQEDGSVKIPEALIPYMGIEIIK